MINLYDTVMLLKNCASEGVGFGELGRVVWIHGGGDGYTAEFVNASGQITGFVTDDAQAFCRWVPGARAVSYSDTSSGPPLTLGRANAMCNTQTTGNNPAIPILV